jgi:hypothetical protein
MSNTATLDSEVKQFMRDWFGKHDIHPPVEELLPLVADENLIMKMPEGSFLGHEGFKQWYAGVKKFVDQSHEINGLEIKTNQNHATVKVIVRWARSVIDDFGKASDEAGFYVAQTWELERSQQTQKLQIVTYQVDYFLPE